MGKAIRSQSKDWVIQDAARQGVKVYKWSAGYWTASAKDCARQAHVSETYMRKMGWVFKARCGILADIKAGRINESEAYRLARKVFEIVNGPDCPATAKGIRQAAESTLALERRRAGNHVKVRKTVEALNAHQIPMMEE